MRPVAAILTPRFHIVDVFAERPYCGNPLAVVVGGDGLSEATMQLIAAEANYSETTFVGLHPSDDGGHRVRIFTPAREIDFAGHPILGTAWVLRHLLEAPSTAPVRLNLSIGQVPVTFENCAAGGELAWFHAPTVRLGLTCTRERIAPALGISPDEIDDRAPVQQASAGTAAVIVPLRSAAALRRCRLDLETYAPLAEEGFPPLVYLFCTETRERGNDLSVRFFFEANGVREDPATGNGAAFLGAYLLEHGLLGSGDLDLRIEQGHEVRRPSLVRLRACRVGAGIAIDIGGQVIPTVAGHLVQGGEGQE